jgi:hypothetical protein
MKQLIIIGALLEGSALTAHGQTIQTMLQQLSALEQYRKTVEAGQHQVVDGLHEIAHLKMDDLLIHEAFFGSFDDLKPVILENGNAINLQTVQFQIIEGLYNALDYYHHLRDQTSKQN